MATCVQPFSASHSASSSRSAVVVLNVRTSRVTSRPSTDEAHASDHGLLVDIEASATRVQDFHRSLLRAPPAWGPRGRSLENVLRGRSSARGTIGGAREAPGPTDARARAHQDKADLTAGSAAHSTSVSSRRGRTTSGGQLILAGRTGDRSIGRLIGPRMRLRPQLGIAEAERGVERRGARRHAVQPGPRVPYAARQRRPLRASAAAGSSAVASPPSRGRASIVPRYRDGRALGQSAPQYRARPPTRPT